MSRNSHRRSCYVLNYKGVHSLKKGADVSKSTISDARLVTGYILSNNIRSNGP